ncbi:MAG TPA: cupin domain-containing protein [Pseudomonadales bacterium]|nr:cupin domain-containing protein [Pseudomonadales bacterium]
MQPRIRLLADGNEFYIDEGCFVIEIANASEDPAVSIARCRVEPGKTTHWHRLRGTVERYVITSGTGLVEIGDLAPQVVTAGDTVIIPAGCRQRIANTGQADLVFLAICTPRFSPDVYEGIEGVVQGN